MKRVGVVGSLIVGAVGLLVPAAASAQQCYRQYDAAESYRYSSPQPYSYGYYSGFAYDSYGRDWREARREHEWREREERREREWRREERREHDRYDRNRWRHRDVW